MILRLKGLDVNGGHAATAYTNALTAPPKISVIVPFSSKQFLVEE